MHAEQQGYSLIELMLAALLAAVVFTLTGYTYLSATRHFKRLQQLSLIQANGQHAMLTLLRHLRRAGYPGYYAGIKPVFGAALTDQTTGRCRRSPRRAASRSRGRNGQPPSVRCRPVSSPRYPYTTGTILTVRYARQQDPSGYAPEQLYLRSTPTTARLLSGRQRRQERKRRQARYADLSVHSHTFYLSRRTTGACGGTTVPVLIDRNIAHNGRPRHQVVADGIEQFRVRYGLREKHGLRYRDAGAVSDWNRVVSIRLWLLIRSECPDRQYRNRQVYRLGAYRYGVNDSYRRLLLSTTVFLPNRYRRVTQKDE